MTYVVVTPLLIVPVVLILARHWLTAEQVSLAVIAFASLGHHLPGFMRAYGDRELFARYRTRFLCVPPLIFALALLFSPPAELAQSLGVPWKHLHGLEFILLIWGTWHGLMQTYGFMRIYDLRQGINDRWSARLDHWLCLAVFAAGVVFSDARVFGIANAMWQSGLPLFGPEWVWWTRVVVGSAGLAVGIAYVLNLVNRRRQGDPVSGLKLLLIGTTGWFYWYTGRLSTNVLIGLAMFEIYHAVQYYALVWIYNRRLFSRASESFGPLGFLFRDRWTMLGMYLAAIGAYSSIRYFTVDANEYVFCGGSENAHQWLVALFVSSSFLHFYFDGFIWRVSEKNTQENIVDEVSEQAASERLVPGLVHAAKIGLLLMIASGLLFAEWRDLPNYKAGETVRARALGALTPNLPESQALLSRNALSRGDARAAVEFAQNALKLRPRSHASRADLGLAMMMSGRLGEAKQQFEEAIDIAPDVWSYHCDLGLVLDRLVQLEQAEQQFKLAVEFQPDLQVPRAHLAEFYLRHSRTSEAAQQFSEIAARFPETLTGEIGQILLHSQRSEHEQAIRLGNFLAIGYPLNWQVLVALGSAYNVAGEGELALVPLEKAYRLRRQSAEVNYQLGLAYFLKGDPAHATSPLRRATRYDPNHFRALFQLANTYYVISRYDVALATYARCRQLQPENSEVCANLGGLYAQLGQIEKAEGIYREGLASTPDSGQLNYNLGILLWEQGRHEGGKQKILRAAELGVAIPAEVRVAIGQSDL